MLKVWSQVTLTLLYLHIQESLLLHPLIISGKWNPVELFHCHSMSLQHPIYGRETGRGYVLKGLVEWHSEA